MGSRSSNTNAPNNGDVIALHAGDWAIGNLVAGTRDYGLVDSSGNTIVTTTPTASTMFNAGFAGEIVGPLATVTLDSIGAYANAAQLVTALQTATVGDLQFVATSTEPVLLPGDVEHVLIAYQSSTGSSSGTAQVNIADVTFTFKAAIVLPALFDTSTAANIVTVTAIDLVDIAGTATTGVNLANLHPNNVWFA